MKTQRQIIRKMKSLSRDYDMWENEAYEANKTHRSLSQKHIDTCYRIQGQLKILEWVSGISYKKFSKARYI